MTRIARLFSAAAVAAGFGLAAAIASAADGQNNRTTTANSGVALVSATDDEPASSDSAVTTRAGSSRSAGNSSADTFGSRTATYPPKQPAARKPATKPATKAGNAATTSTDPQFATARKQLASSGTRRAAPAQADAPPLEVVHRDSHLTAHFAVAEEQPEAVKSPMGATTPPPSPPPMGAPQGEYCQDCGGGCGGCCDCCVWDVGVEYMFLRPHFGNDPAFHQLTQTTTAGSGNSPGLVTNDDRAVNFDFGYDSDFRVYVGRHLGNGELRFGYTHIQDDADAAGVATRGVATNNGIALVGALGGSQLSGAGDMIESDTHLHLNMFDIDRVQDIELPSCNPCGSGWDVSWSYGVRIIDVNRAQQETDFVAATGATSFFDLDSTFVGAGPKLGIEARRNLWGTRLYGYFGANASLLVGHYKSQLRSFFPTTTPGAQDTLDTQENSLTRAVPNVEMQIGVTWQPTCRTMLTAGWMVESFTDVAASTANTGGCNNCMPSPISGSGNILSFDGLFIRMEHCF